MASLIKLLFSLEFQLLLVRLELPKKLLIGIVSTVILKIILDSLKHLTRLIH